MPSRPLTRASTSIDGDCTSVGVQATLRQAAYTSDASLDPCLSRAALTLVRGAWDVGLRRIPLFLGRGWPLMLCKVGSAAKTWSIDPNMRRKWGLHAFSRRDGFPRSR